MDEQFFLIVFGDQQRAGVNGLDLAARFQAPVFGPELSKYTELQTRRTRV